MEQKETAIDKLLKAGLTKDYANSISVTMKLIEDNAYNFMGESKTMKFCLSPTDKICLDSMQKNGESLGTMTLVMIDGSTICVHNSVEYYALVQSVRTAIKEYLKLED